MLTDIQEWSLLLIVVCIFMLAAINIFLVLQLLKGSRGDAAQLGNIVAQCQQIMAAQGAVKEMVAATADSLEEATLSELDGALSASLDALADADQGTRGLLEDLQQATPDDLAAWRDMNAERISELLAEQQLMQQRMASLQELLTNANATILNLRSRSRRGEGTEPGNDNKLVEELQQVRRNAARLSTELNAAHANVQALTEGVATRELMLAEAVERHSDERNALEARISILNAQVQSMQDTFDRTIVEKSFIEEAFLAIEERDKTP